ncbi:PEP-CTERM sorting domain-containing protein [Methylomonas sp. AM2-LC]|uniref:PEP-CTERM sorting domain-containing protein n=1 Tax=Methylomonas sp. AM2-LC TaxID=3153301 RepID=UPI0032658614
MRKKLFYIGIMGVVVFMRNVQADTFTSDIPQPFPQFNQPGNPSYHSADIVYPGTATIKAGDFQFTPTSVSSIQGNEVDTLSTHFVGFLDAFGSNTAFSLDGITQVTVMGRSSASPLGSFLTQITSMDLTGVAGGHTIELKLDPTASSTGISTISPNGTGQFNISSFFDVVIDLSIDGAPLTPPSSGTNTNLATAVPEPSTFILMGMGFLGLIRSRNNA